jgi:predicted DNA-binding transcriptional regulator AlpA
MVRRTKDTQVQESADRQLSLSIDAEGDFKSLNARTTRHIRRRTMDAEQILWMEDVVSLTGKHRCTIHRWINEGSFPKKDAPKHKPRGWRRSTYESWLLGAPVRLSRRCHTKSNS